MYFNSGKSLMIDFVDFVLVILKKIWIVIIVAIFVAGVVFGEKYYSGLKIFKTSIGKNVLDVSVKLPEETNTTYDERILNVNRAADLIDSISAINTQIENQRKYVSESVFMEIDPENEAMTTVNLLIEVDGNLANGIDLALASSYKQYLLSGVYLSDLSKDLGVNQGYLTELVKVDYDTSHVLINTSENKDNVGVVSISVIGPSDELTNRIMDSIIDGTNSICYDFKKSIVEHSISFSSRTSSYIVDSSTRDKQINVTNRFESLQTQINNYNKSLDEVATKLGVSKSVLYSYFSYNDSNFVKSTFSYRSIIKFAVIGFIIGALFVVLLFFIKYAFSAKFSNQSVFFCRFNSVTKIGVEKPSIKRNKYTKFIDVISGDDNKLTIDKNHNLISANIKNLCAGMNKIMITGTAEFDKTLQLINSLGVAADVKASFFDDPTSLELASNYDGVIIVEQRNYSDCRLVNEEINLIQNSGVKLIGAIII